MSMGTQWVKSIELSFENGEVYYVDGKDITRIFIDGITERIEGTGRNRVLKLKICEYVHLEIDKRGNKTSSGSFDNDVTLFARVRSTPDITSITVKYEDGSEGEIYVPWENGRSAETNKWQETLVDEDGEGGSIEIIIAPPNPVLDIKD